MNKHKKTGNIVSKVVIYIALIVLAISIIVPVAWVFMATSARPVLRPMNTQPAARVRGEVAIAATGRENKSARDDTRSTRREVNLRMSGALKSSPIRPENPSERSMKPISASLAATCSFSAGSLEVKRE